MNKIFKNEKSIFGKLEKTFWKFYEKEAFRFLIAGGLNTLFGTVGAILLRLIFEYFSWNAKIDFSFLTELGLVSPNMDIPYLIVFVVLLPVAYTLQAKISFQTKWEWKRLLIYPISSIPNFICQELFIWLFEVVLGVPSSISYILSPICSLPIMFFIIRILVKPFKKDANKKLKNIKYIFCDIDGTLVTSNFELQDQVVSYIKDNNFEDRLFLISGRNYKGMKGIHDKLGLNTPLICGNGSVISSKDKNIQFIKTIPSDLVKEIFEEYKDQDLSLSIYDDFNWYANKENKHTLHEEKIVNFKSIIINNLDGIKDVTKIMLIADEEKTTALFEVIKNKYKQLMVEKSKPTFIEIMNSEVNKGNAIKILKEKYNMRKNEIMSIGDSVVDAKMFKECGINIVVANASEDIKKQADFVVSSNNDAGVVEALKKLK